jgi:hypothetical protein
MRCVRDWMVMFGQLRTLMDWRLGQVDKMVWNVESVMEVSWASRNFKD